MMMPTGYSTLFALGLSNVHSPVQHEFITESLSSPLPASNGSLCTPVSSTPDSASSEGPLASSTFEPPVKPTKLNVDTQVSPMITRTRNRRRRSSCSTAAHPAGVVKTPVCAKPAVLVPGNKVRSRRSDGDMVVTRNRRNSIGEPLRSRRGAVLHTPAPAPPNAPLPPVPSLPTNESDASGCLSSELSTKSASLTASEQDNQFLCGESLPSCPFIARGLSFTATMVSSPSLSSSPQTLLTPAFATRLVHSFATPPASPTLAPTSPVDPVLGHGRSYFEAFAPADEVMLVN